MYPTLDEFVNNYLSEMELPDSSYRRIYDIAIRCYRFIHNNATGASITVQLPILANKTSELPVDFQNKIALGEINQKGEFASWVEDSLLTFKMDDTPARLEQPRRDDLISNENNVWYQNGIWYPYPYNYQQLGVGTQPEYPRYRIDLGARLIVFEFHIQRTEVTLEYLPIAGAECGYVVNPLFQECFISWMQWKDMRNSRSDRIDGERDFFNFYRISKRSMKPFDPSDASNAFRATTIEVPRA